METQAAEVISNERIAEKTHVIRLNKALDFKPGQWVYVFVDKWGFQIKKPYTIFSLPGDNVELLVEDVGYVSNKLCQLKQGDKIEISSVFGDFTVKDSHHNNVFIAFDSGIAPFKPMIDEALNNNHNAHLIYLSEKDGMVSEDFFVDLEFNDNFALEKCTSLKKPEFNEKLKASLGAIKKIDAVYICGLIYLVEDARKVCSRLGISNVYFENWV